MANVGSRNGCSVGLHRYGVFGCELRAFPLELQEAEVDAETHNLLLGRIETLGSKLRAFEVMDSMADPSN